MNSQNETSELSSHSATDEFRNDVVNGLSCDQKAISCKYFYDQRGSQLFDDICDLDEYYLTDVELSIMERYSDEMADQIGEGVLLVEYGSGSSVKTKLLLDALIDPVAYVPVDISGEHLSTTAKQLAREYPKIEILPVCADFTEPFELPKPETEPTHAAVYFPGSTIGNFQPEAAKTLLGRIAPLCGKGGGLLIGIDLKKDIDTIEAAYNDRKGVTAEFNLNLLRRINRELDADFDLEQFSHVAEYDSTRGRVRIGLVSQQDQTVSIGNESFEFQSNEFVHTEYSHKYTIEQFATLADEVGLSLHRHWTDQKEWFGVLHFVVK